MYEQPSDLTRPADPVVFSLSSQSSRPPLSKRVCYIDHQNTSYSLLQVYRMA